MEFPVSVIIPVYNVEAYLCRCLDSVCGQTLKDIEIICINDGSTDHGLEILKKYQAVDARIVLVDFKKNMGVSVARNHGIDIAKGEYVGFVDSDDMIDHDFYEKLYCRAKEENAVVVKGIAVHFDNTGSLPRSVGFLSPKDISNDPTNFFGEFWSAIYRKKFLIDNNIIFPVGVKTGQDTAFLLKAISLIDHVSTVGDVYYRYHVRDGSSSFGRFGKSKYLSILSAMQDVVKFLNTHSIYCDRYDKTYYHLFMHCLSMLKQTSDDYNESSAHCAGVMLDLYKKCRRREQLDKKLLCSKPALYHCLHSGDLPKLLVMLKSSLDLIQKQDA
ncbi:MAG: glycosyltransferase [Desulfovibrio sp.]|jgi:glycosyltransferase involved in cell wall biosynthesis|nr:glycosyltransferase [Desulfovibrio sp.]